MPLDGYSPPTYRVRDSRAARVVITANSSATDETGCQTQAARETHQEGEQDRAQHWGFSSNPPAETEGISILDQYGSRVVVAERVPCPVALADGETCLWTSANTFVHLKSTGNVEVRAENAELLLRVMATAYAKLTSAGKVEINSTTGQDVVTTSGRRVYNYAETDFWALVKQYVYLGLQTTETYYKCARKGDTVAAQPSMGTWLTTITAAVNTLIGGGTPAAVVPPGDFGTISTGSAVVKVA